MLIDADIFFHATFALRFLSFAISLSPLLSLFFGYASMPYVVVDMI